MIHCFDSEVAKKYGLLEAVIVNHIFFWLEKNRTNDINYHDGDYWTYNSTAAFQQQFPYASRRQIERALNHLRDEGVLKTANYNDNKYDRTLWYAFTEKGKSISQIGEMDIPKNVNRNSGLVEPIPDTETDTETDTESDIKSSSARPCDFDSIKSTYNAICSNLPSCRTLTEKRKKAIKAWLKDFDPDQWQEVCEASNKSGFLTGDNDRGWKADIDFLLRPDKAAKILEGGYADKPSAGQSDYSGGEDFTDFLRR